MFSECPDGVNGQLLLLRQQCGRYMALSKVSEPLFRRSPDRHVLAAQSPLTLTIWPLRSRHRRMLTLCSVRPSRWAASRIGTSMINPSSSGVHLRRPAGRARFEAAHGRRAARSAAHPASPPSADCARHMLAPWSASDGSMTKVQRVVIVGPGAAGKSVLAARLGEI